MQEEKKIQSEYTFLSRRRRQLWFRNKDNKNQAERLASGSLSKEQRDSLLTPVLWA